MRKSLGSPDHRSRMRFLTDSECRAWASAHRYPLDEHPYAVLADAPPFTVLRFRIPKDAGRRVALARTLWSQVGAGRPEVLIWATDWSIWPSGEHMPLTLALRRGLGETRPIKEAPGCLTQMGEDDEALSWLTIALLFLWDAWLLAPDSQLAVFVSHDEYGEVCTRGEMPESLRRALDALAVLDRTPAA
jgi:hypothetical protein